MTKFTPTIVCTVLVFNVSVYFLPGSAPRRLWEKRRDADSDVIAFLEERGIEAVSGASFSTVMLSMMEAIEQVASPQVLPCFDMLERWQETTERLARDAAPAGSRPAAAGAAAPGPGR